MKKKKLLKDTKLRIVQGIPGCGQKKKKKNCTSEDKYLNKKI